MDAARVRAGGALGVEVVGFGGRVGALFGPALLGEVSIDGKGIVGPEVRLGFSRFEVGALVVTPGTAQFTWYRVEAQGCPLRLALGSVAVRPCFVAVLGALEAAGAAATPESSTRAWVELGGSALVDWDVVGPLGLEGEAGFVGVPLRDSFQFTQPNTFVYQAPREMAEARLGLRVRFP